MQISTLGNLNHRHLSLNMPSLSQRRRITPVRTARFPRPRHMQARVIRGAMNTTVTIGDDNREASQLIA
jgi:hypothetical protein